MHDQKGWVRYYYAYMNGNLKKELFKLYVPSSKLFAPLKQIARSTPVVYPMLQEVLKYGIVLGEYIVICVGNGMKEKYSLSILIIALSTV